MPIRVKCPVCGYRIKAPDGSYGRRGQCPRCKLMIRLPTEAEANELEQQAVGDPAASASAKDPARSVGDRVQGAEQDTYDDAPGSVSSLGVQFNS